MRLCIIIVRLLVHKFEKDEGKLVTVDRESEGKGNRDAFINTADVIDDDVAATDDDEVVATLDTGCCC